MTAPQAPTRALSPFERGMFAAIDAQADAGFLGQDADAQQFRAGMLEALHRPPVAQGIAPAATAQQKLKIALAQALDDSLRWETRAGELESVLQALAGDIAPVVLAHLRGDGAGVCAALTKFANEHCKQLLTAAHDPAGLAGHVAAPGVMQ